MALDIDRHNRLLRNQPESYIRSFRCEGRSVHSMVEKGYRLLRMTQHESTLSCLDFCRLKSRSGSSQKGCHLGFRGYLKCSWDRLRFVPNLFQNLVWQLLFFGACWIKSKLALLELKCLVQIFVELRVLNALYLRWWVSCIPLGAPLRLRWVVEWVFCWGPAKRLFRRVLFFW